MKKTTLLKTLLMAVGLFMGTSAWGAVTWDFTNSATWGSVTLPSAGNSFADVSYDATGAVATTGNFITIHSTTGKIVHATTQTNGFAFAATGSTSDNYIKMSVPAGSTVTVFGYYSSNRTLQVSFKGGTTTLTSGGWADYSKDFVNDGVEALDLYIYCNANAGGAGQAPFLKSISLKQTVAVTINYRDKDDQENTLVSSVVENVEVGTSYTPTHETTLYVSDSDPYEYTYESGADPVTINEATTINVLYSKGDRAQYSYVVTSIKNEDKAVIKTLQEGTLYKGASVTVPYPSCYNVGGTLYTRGTTSNEFRQVVTPDKDNYSKTFPYTAQSTTNVVYLVEGEDIAGATRNTTGTNVVVRASNAAAASIPDGGVAVCTLPAGTYSLNLWMSHTRNNAEVTTTFGYGETEFTVTTTGTNRVQAAAKEFTLTETSTLVCKGISGDGLLDNLYITGTPTNEIVGALDYSTAFMGAHKDLTISQGQQITINFKNQGIGTNAWYNWLLRLSGTTGVDQTVRADNYVVGDGESSVSTRSITEDGGAITWADFVEDMKDGSVELTATYTHAGMFSVEATATGASHTYVHNFAYNAAKSGDITMELGVEKAWLEVLSTETTYLPVPATIGATGYATFSSTYALDFTDVTALDAYTATACNGSYVTLSKVTGTVAANTGLVLIGESADIPVVASGDTQSGNMLVACSSETNVTPSPTGTNYVLSVQSGDVVFAPVTGDNATVAAGHAFLYVPSAGARTLSIVFADEETTGIKNLNVDLNLNNKVFDLQGRRVAQPAKGLYIVNGKKVVIK